MRWYHSTKTAKIFWVTLDVAMHGAAYGRPMRSPMGASRDFLTFFPPTALEVRPLKRFSRKIAQSTWTHARMSLLQ